MRRNITAILSGPVAIRSRWQSGILVSFLLLFFPVFHAIAADGEGLLPIGRADRLIQDSMAQHGETDLHKLAKNQPVFLGHNLVTGPKSGTRLRLRDGSFIAIGPDARAALEDFLFSPIDDQSSLRLDITKGVFTIVSGAKMAGHQLAVKTPVAVINIRGSLLRGFHWPGFASMFYLPAGEADVTTGSGEAALLKAGDMLVVPHDSQEAGQDIPPAMQAEIVRYVEGRLKPLRLNGKIPKQTAATLETEGAQNLTLARQQEHRIPSTGGAALISANAATEPAAINHARSKMPLLANAIDSGYFNRNASSADKDAIDASMHDAAHASAGKLMGKLTRHLQKTSSRSDAMAAKQIAAGIALSSSSGRDIALTAKSLAAGNPATAKYSVAGALAIKGKTDRPDIAADVAAKAVEGAPARTFEIIESAIKALPDAAKVDGARKIAKRITDDNPAMLAEVNLWVNRLQPDANLHVPEHQRERAALAIDAAALGFVNEKVREPAPDHTAAAGPAKDTFRQSASSDDTASGDRAGLPADGQDIGSGDGEESFLASINWPLVMVIALGLLFATGTAVAILRMVKARDRRNAA